MAGLVFHRNPVGRMAERDAFAQARLLGEKIIQDLLVTHQDRSVSCCMATPRR
jgi:hypothetical protein